MAQPRLASDCSADVTITTSDLQLEEDAEQGNVKGADGATNNKMKRWLKETSDASTAASTAAAAAVRKSFTSPSNVVLAAGCVLAMCAGAVNATCWLQLGTFVSHVSGNVSHIGMRVQGTHAGRDTPSDLFEAIGLVVSFCMGSVLCGLLITSSNVRFGKEMYGMALLGNASLLFVTMFLGLSQAEHALQAAKFFAAAACGLQNGMCTMHFGAICRTTHVTGLVTDAGTAIGRLLALNLRQCLRGNDDLVERAEREVERRKLRVYFLLGFGFLSGAGSGSYLSHFFGLYAFLFPAITTAIGGACYLFSQPLIRMEEQWVAAHHAEIDHMLERARNTLHSLNRHGHEEVHHVMDFIRNFETSIVNLVHHRRAHGGDKATPTKTDIPDETENMNLSPKNSRPTLPAEIRQKSPTKMIRNLHCLGVSPVSMMRTSTADFMETL